jgi:hypothetical protein
LSRLERNARARRFAARRHCRLAASARPAWRPCPQARQQGAEPA